MQKWLLAAIFLAAAPMHWAVAGETTLAYRAVMYVAESHSAPILDNDAHVIGVGKFRGLAILPDDEIAVHRYEGWFDLTDGSGRFQGYMLFRFDDGSQIRARYEGTVREASPDDFGVEATVHDISGTGLYAEISGSGSFRGRRMEAITSGGSTYVTGELSLSRPD